MKQVNSFHIGIFFRSEIALQIRGGFGPFKGGGGGEGNHECQRRELCRAVWGYIFQKLLKIRVSKMAIPSILRPISYSFNTNYLLVNFAIVIIIIKNLQKESEHRPPTPTPLDPPLQIHVFNSSCLLKLGSHFIQELFSVRFWALYPAIFVLLPKTHIFVTFCF